MKANKGITLVALVITIIILIILAGVSISLVMGDNGIATKARQGATNYQNATKEEMSLINTLLDNVGFDQTGGGSGGGGNPPATYAAYSIGQEVKVGEEEFYVLEASDSTQGTVTLFAKYNLNSAGTAQAKNERASNVAVAFSSEYYWEDAYTNYTDWSTKKLDINTVSGAVAGDAIYKAKQYAKTVSGDNNNNSGRLLTYEEAYNLNDSYGDMIWGPPETQMDPYYYDYWLSAADDYQGNRIRVVKSKYKNTYFDNISYGDLRRSASSYNCFKRCSSCVARGRRITNITR